LLFRNLSQSRSFMIHANPSIVHCIIMISGFQPPSFLLL
jgi:hypothetical protein